MKNISFILFSLLLFCITSCSEDSIVYNTASRAGISVESNQYEVGEAVRFTDSTILEEGNEIVSYLWEFGDEAKSTSNEQNPTFTYKKDGVFIVKLTVTDNNNLKASANKEITIVNPTKPDFTWDKEEYMMGDVVKFQNQTTTKAGTTVTSYLWEFGDEAKSTSTEQNPSFVYQKAGAYSVKLTVTDSYGLTAKVTKNVTIFDPSKSISILWSSTMTGTVNGGSSPTISLDGTSVYMLTGGSDALPGKLESFNISNGASAWSFNIDNAMRAKHSGGSTVAGAKDIFGSPSVGSNGDIYFIVRDLKDSGAERRLYVFSVKQNGTINWAYEGYDKNVYSITPAIDNSGNIYVAHRGAKIWKLSPSGTQTELASTSVIDLTAGLSISKSGILYGTGKSNTGVMAYNTVSDNLSWTYNADFGGASEAFTGALKSAAISIGIDGTVYTVTDLTTGGAILALNSDGSLKWKYATNSSIPDGGVVLGSDGTIYANGGIASGSNTGGIIALNSNGTLKWHYSTTVSVQTTPLIDNRGYIHFIDAKANYYVIKPDGTLFSTLNLGGESTVSSPVMDETGKLFVAIKKGEDALEVAHTITTFSPFFIEIGRASCRERV